MPAALATPLRRQIVEAYLAGKSMKAIAEQGNISYSCVRTYCRRYREGGFEGLSPDYQNCGRRTRNDLIYRGARYLKYLHRGWGAALIRLKLKQRYPNEQLPSVRTMQRWFKQANLSPLRKQLAKPTRQWAQAAHEVWKIDAKEQLKLEDGSKACYLTVTDEHSGALLEAPLFSPQSDQSS